MVIKNKCLPDTHYLLMYEKPSFVPKSSNRNLMTLTKNGSAFLLCQRNSSELLYSSLGEINKWFIIVVIVVIIITSQHEK